MMSAASGWARDIVSLDADWKFFQGEVSGAEKADFREQDWETVCVPHDWAIAGSFSKDAPSGGPGGWLPSGISWYRKNIALSEEVAGKRVWIEFDGIMANSDVWMNGAFLGHRPCGYTSFRYDVTDVVKPGGENWLVVKSDTSEQPASRWYTGAGIYRHVRMIIVEPVHIKPWGVYVTTPEVSESQAMVNCTVEVENTSSKSLPMVLRSYVVNSDGKTVASNELQFVLLGSGSYCAEGQRLLVKKPRLWNLEAPELYALKVQLLHENTLIDEVTTPFGIRSAEFKSETGFWLNGENIKLKGVCLHHDGGAVGAAVPLAVWERRFKLMKELGVNAIRTAHNPPAPEFLDLCDRMGFLVMDEIFDVWQKGKKGADKKKLHDYHLHFDEWAHTDLRESILRDRNHPSIILYSVGNEIHDTPNAKQAKKILRGLVEICHETDPTRPVTQGLFRPNKSHDYDNGLADMLDVIGTNYRDDELLQAWKDKEGRKIVVTEERYEASNWVAVRDNPPLSGHFLWPGIDYLGESSRWPLTVFNNGMLDRCGFIMPRGREHQSWWSDKPMVAAFRRVAPDAEAPEDPGYEEVEWERRQVLFPDWNPRNTDPHHENVEVYSNAESVELFLNGESFGKKTPRNDCEALSWNVPYREGVLEVVASNEGKEVARDTLQTAGKPAEIRLVPDRERVGHSWDDVVHVEVNILDEKGTLVPGASNPIRFQIEGACELLGVDSGNVVSVEPFKASERNAYQGRCLAILRATDAGTIKLIATADGLPAATLSITAE